jgi:hypothetical protein
MPHQALGVPFSAGRPAVDFLHGGWILPPGQQRPGVERTLQRFLDQRPLLTTGFFQDVVHHLIAVAGMANADAQAPEILRAEMRSNVLEPVVPAETSAELQAQRTRCQVELVVQDQHVRRRDTVEMRQGRDRLPGAVHESLRHEQPDLLVRAAGNAMEAGFTPEFRAKLRCQPLA